MRTLSAALLCGWLLAAAAPSAAQSVPSACRKMVTAIGVPDGKGSGAGRVTLCRDGYVLSHDNGRKTPQWVVERLSPERFVGPGDRDEQGNPFKADPDLEAKGAPHATPKDYAKQKSEKQKRSFDQGHMAPAADMKFSIDATIQSFYMSNMAPQQGSGLNRHIWADLEKLARDWACDRKDMYVITGPIYDDEEPEVLGADEVAVPDAFYKLAYEPKQKRLIAFILPNEAIDKKGKKSFDALQAYITTLAAVEERTGINFLSALDARDHRRIAGLKSVMWPVVKGCVAK